MQTPWGKANYKKPIVPGITFYGTPSHGGIKVKAKINHRIPEYIRKEDGWYEEDCDWAIVTFIFPQFFSWEERSQAKHTFMNWYPDEYEKFTGEILKEGESYKKDEKNFLLAHKNDYLVLSAWGDWHKDVPKGFVGIFAGRGGRLSNGQYSPDTAYFLVPEIEYVCPDRFIIDETKHQRISQII